MNKTAMRKNIWVGEIARERVVHIMPRSFRVHPKNGSKGFQCNPSAEKMK
jgi:hypothetical protein